MDLTWSCPALVLGTIDGSRRSETGKAFSLTMLVEGPTLVGSPAPGRGPVNAVYFSSFRFFIGQDSLLYCAAVRALDLPSVNFLSLEKGRPALLPHFLNYTQIVELVAACEGDTVFI